MNKIRAMIGLLAALTSAQILGAEPVGRVIMSKGHVISTSFTTIERKLERRDRVFEAETLVTGDNSLAQVRFIDSGMIALHSNTSLYIDSYRQTSDSPQDNKVVLKLIEGGFRTLTGKFGKGSPNASYEVQTPAGSIGIRGTLYSAHLENGQLIVAVWKGGIRVTTKQGAFNVGMDADYNYAKIDAQTGRFTGLLTPPSSVPPNTRQLISVGNTNRNGLIKTEQSALPKPRTSKAPKPTPPKEEPKQPTPPTPENPTPVTSPVTEPPKEEPVKPLEPVTQQPVIDPITDAETITADQQNTLLTKQQWEKYNANSRPAILGTQKDINTGRVFNDGDETFFVTKNTDGTPKQVYQMPSGQSATLPNGIEWGNWGAKGGIGTMTQLGDKGMIKNEIQPLLIAQIPALDTQSAQQLNQLGGTYRFKVNNSVARSKNQIIAIGNVSGGFLLDVNSGKISQGSIKIDGSATQWNMVFEGQANPQGNVNQLANIDVTGGTISVQGQNDVINIDKEKSRLTGAITVPKSKLVFGGAFKISDTDSKYVTDGVLTMDSEKQ